MRVQTKRLVNFSGQTRIDQGDVSIVTGLTERGTASYRLMRCDLPETHGSGDAWPSANVIVEARRSSTDNNHRAVIGTVAEVRAREGQVIWDQDLDGFAGLATIKFRVKVVCAETSRLLAEAETVLADNERPRNRSELLPVVPVDLGEEVWRLAVSEEDGMPELHIHVGIVERGAQNTAEFRSLVLPEAVRQALRIAMGAKQDEETEPQWVAMWMSFARERAGKEPEDGADRSATEDWVNSVVARFSAAADIRETFISALDRASNTEGD